jgi:hypothetical protein
MEPMVTVNKMERTIAVTIGWASLSSSIKIRSAMANESPNGTAPLLDESFLPGDIEYESPNGNIHIYFWVISGHSGMSAACQRHVRFTPESGHC